jgi:hypothetical protein
VVSKPRPKSWRKLLVPRLVPFYLGRVLPGAQLWPVNGEIPKSFPLLFRIRLRYGLLSQIRVTNRRFRKYTGMSFVQREPESHLDFLIEDLRPFIEHPPSRLIALSFKDDDLVNRLRRVFEFGRPERFFRGEIMAEVLAEASRRVLESRESGGSSFLVTRHLLEHLPSLRRFLKLCQSLAGREGYVLVEVPDCSRAFESMDFSEFWDEHVHYFTPSSLRRCLEGNGLTVVFLKTYEGDGEAVICALATISSKRVLTTRDSIRGQTNEIKSFLWAAKGFSKSVSRFLISEGFSRMLFIGANHRTSNFIDLFVPRSMDVAVIDDDVKKQKLIISSRKLMVNGRSDFVSSKKGNDLIILSMNRLRSNLIKSKLQMDLGASFQGKILCIQDLFFAVQESVSGPPSTMRKFRESMPLEDGQ